MKIDYEKIDRVLNNQASSKEAKEVLDWFETEQGQRYLSERITEDSMSDRQVTKEWLKHPVPTQKMRARFLTSIGRKPMYMRWQWVAAVIIPFLMVVGSAIYVGNRSGIFSPTEYAEFSVPCGEQLQIAMQDGSIIQLNSDSRLRYPKKFGLFDRRVELMGEAYFIVAKDHRRPFIVDLGGLEVKVTGTQFNVKAYSSESIIRVTLSEGGVLLKDARHKEYALVPGESAEYNRKSGVCDISQPDNIFTIMAWRSNSLNFYRIPLSEIIKTLARQYDVRFIIEDSLLLDNRFTISTSKVQIKDILNDLEFVSHIRFSDKGNNTFMITSAE